MADVAVVGGGPAGLTTALALARGGHAVTLVESSGRLGGMAASITVDGVRCDLGSHRLHPVATPEVERLLVELLGDDLQVRPRNGRIGLAGRWVRFPLRPLDVVRSLPPGFALRAARDAAMGPWRSRRGGGGDDTFAAVVERGLGPAMVHEFYGPYAQKLWGVPADELAGDLARRRIANNAPGRIIAKLARAARGAQPVFRYPRHGYGQIVESLVDRCARHGVELLTDATVASLDDVAGGLRLACSVAGEPPRSIEVDRVFWTASPTALARVSAAPPSALARPRHRSMVCLFLTYEGPRVTPYDAHYLPGLDSLPTRISEPTNYRDGDDPDDRTVLCAEIPCDPGDTIATATPETLMARVADDLRRLGVTDREPVAAHSQVLSAVYPVVTPADVEPVDQLLRWAHGQRCVTVLGRQGLVVADNLHHVMEMGLEAAACLDPAGTWDAQRWGAAVARVATNVVED